MTVCFYKAKLLRDDCPIGFMSGFVDVKDGLDAKQVEQVFEEAIASRVEKIKEGDRTPDNLRWTIELVTSIPSLPTISHPSIVFNAQEIEEGTTEKLAKIARPIREGKISIS